MSDEPHPPQDDEKFFTPRNMIAAVILALFATQTLLPYWIAVPEGRTGDMIANGAKVVETVLVLVLGAYFGDSLASRRKDRALASSAQANATLAATAKTAGDVLANAAPTSGTATITAAPDVDVQIREADPGAP